MAYGISRRGFVAATAAGVGTAILANQPGRAAQRQSGAADDGQPAWWLRKPMRLVQTNLREIDAGLDLDTYVARIKDLAAEVVLFNTGGIVANYPTRLEFHYRNPHLKGDLVGRVVERLHREGMRMIGRFDFSKINETLAAHRPEWLYRSAKGQHVNYNGQVHTCVNGGYQQEYLFEILGEAIDRYPLDGVFFNMIGYVTRDYSGNEYGMCRCDACRARFRKEHGLELPDREDRRDPAFRTYEEFRRRTSDELFQRVNRFVKAKRESVAICTSTAAGVDIIRRESNSALDRPLPEWNYSASDNVKSVLCTWKDKVVTNAAVHFVDFPYRHSGVPPHLTGLRLAQDLIHNGWIDFYCIGTLEGLEDRLALGPIRDVFRFHAEHERWFTGTRSLADVCLVRGPSEETRGLFRILAENQVAFDCMESSAIAADPPRALGDYAAVVIADVRNLSDTACRRLDDYVAAGGRVLATGRTSLGDVPGDSAGSSRLLASGVKAVRRVHAHKRGAYLRVPAEDRKRLGAHALDDLDVIYLDSELVEFDLAEGTQRLLGLIPQSMYGPPEKCYYTEVTDIPGLVYRRHVQGGFAWFPWTIGSHYERRSNPCHSLAVMAALEGLLGFQAQIRVDASPLVEISRHADRQGRFEWIGLVNHSGQMGTAFHVPVPIRRIPVQFRPQRPLRSVRLLRAEKDIEFEHSDDGWVRFVVPELGRFEVLLAEYA